MTPDELEELLFLAMLKLQRAGAGPVFDLEVVCSEEGIEASRAQLIAFIVDNDSWRGKDHKTLQSLRFELNAEGMRHARNIEVSRKPLTAWGRIAQIPRSDWISLGALIISAIALLKN